MKYIFLAIFIVSTAFHLYASLRKETKMRNISKPFIILSLLGFYILAARQVSAAIVIALILSWIGDVLLIPKGIKWFTAGGISFMIGHFFFILGYLKDIDFAAIPVFAIILLAIFFTAASGVLYTCRYASYSVGENFAVMLPAETLKLSFLISPRIFPSSPGLFAPLLMF
jgi:uncharacterized membrane protein YhhN